MNRGNQPQRSSWKKSTRRSEVPASGVGSYGTGEFGQRGRSRRRLLFQVSSLATLAVGLGIILFLYLIRRPNLDVPLVFVGVSQSSTRNANDPLPPPPNPFVYEDARLMNDWFKKDSDQHLVFVGSVEEQTGPMSGTTSGKPTLLHSVLMNLGSVKPGGSKNNMVAVFLTAGGIIDHGEPYFLVGDSQVSDSSTWVPVEDFFQGLKNYLESDQWEFKDARLAIFLDAGRGGEAWDWGKTSTSFTSACERVISKIAPEKIAVFASCQDGQRSWCDPRGGKSLFAEAVVEALTGNGDADNNGTVTLGEIESYVATQVATDAKAIWAADQKPVLLTPTSQNWKFIAQPDAVAGPPTINADIDEVASSFEFLDQLWQRHNELSQLHHPPLITQPVAWAVLEKKLARLDLLSVSGHHYRGELKILRGECEALLAELDSGTRAIPKATALPELEMIRFFHGDSEPTVKEQEFDTVLRSGVPLEKVDVQPEIDEFKMMGLLWDWLKEADFSPDRIQSAGELLDKVTSARGVKPRLLETQLIRLLSSSDLPQMHGARGQPIIQTHLASRRSLLLPDLRASFWVRQQLTPLDDRRMLFSDALFARGDSGGAEVRLQRMIDEDYSELQQLGEFVSSAYRLRDEMLHRVPRISETLLSDWQVHGNTRDLQKTASLIAGATEKVRCLTTNLRLIDKNLSIGDPDGDVDQLRLAYQAARESMNRLQGRMLDRVDNASLQAAGDERGLRKTHAMLRGSGVADAANRKRIHDRLIEHLRADSRSQQTVSASESELNKLESRTPYYIDNQHPWQYWLNQTESFSCESVPNPTDEEVIVDEDFQGDQIRGAIVELRLESGDDVRLLPKQLANNNESLAVVRQPIEDLDLDYRRQTSLITSRLDPIERATADRYALDLQLFSLDQASRTLDEFWCEGREFERPFFAFSAGKWLAVEAFRPIDPVLDSMNIQEQYDLASTTAMASETLVPRPDDQYSQGALLDNLGDDPVAFSIDRPAIFPEGEVTLWSAKESKLLSLGDSDTETITAPLRIPADFKAKDGGFAVHSFFRGMRRKGKLELKKLSDPRVTLYRRPKYVAPTAIVESDVQGAENVVIVLDCSGSMSGGKLEQARTAVRGYIDSLKRNKCSIALVLFGHRYGWDQKGGMLQRNKSVAGKKYKVYTMRYHQKVPLQSLGLSEMSGHHPDTDVVVAVDLDEPTDQHIAVLKDALEDTDPVGITPTYHAIDKAYGVLGGKPGHIVVLTDGLPELTNQRPSSYRGDAVQKYKSSKNVRLSIVDFRNKKSQESLRKDFVGATIVDADSASELSEQLENTIASTSVMWKNSGESASRDVGLDQIVAIESWPPLDSEIAEGLPQRPALPYRVEAIRRANSNRSQASVKVEGGEAFRLRVSGKSLHHLPFPRNEYICKDLRVEGPDSSKFSALAIQPDRNDNRELNLRLVLQSKRRGAFTPRCADAWIDIRGTDSERKKSIEHSISLTAFESGRSVPILLARVKDWPNWAVNVNLEAFLRFQGIKVEGTRLPLASTRPFKIPTVDGVSFKVDQEKRGTHEVTITETHQSNDLIGKLRIQLDPLPREAEVRVYRKERIVIRKFRYNSPQESLRGTVTRKDQITNGASLRIRTRDSIPVRIDGR